MVTELNGGAEHERVVYLCVAAGQAVGLNASGVEPQVFINYARDSTTLGQLFSLPLRRYGTRAGESSCCRHPHVKDTPSSIPVFLRGNRGGPSESPTQRLAMVLTSDAAIAPSMRFPHVRGAPRRGRPQPMLLHLTPAGRSTLDERVVGCFRKCLVAAMTSVYLVNCAVQQHAGERTPRGLTAQRLKPVDRWFAQEFTLVIMVIIKDVAKVSDKAPGNLDAPVVLERSSQRVRSLRVVERGVRGPLGQSLPARTHVQAPVWSVAHVGVSSDVTNIF